MTWTWTSPGVSSSEVQKWEFRYEMTVMSCLCLKIEDISNILHFAVPTILQINIAIYRSLCCVIFSNIPVSMSGPVIGIENT